MSVFEELIAHRPTWPLESLAPRAFVATQDIACPSQMNPLGHQPPP